jgi:hypothetical protein
MELQMAIDAEACDAGTPYRHPDRERRNAMFKLE